MHYIVDEQSERVTLLYVVNIHAKSKGEKKDGQKL